MALCLLGLSLAACGHKQVLHDDDGTTTEREALPAVSAPPTPPRPSAVLPDETPRPPKGDPAPSSKPELVSRLPDEPHSPVEPVTGPAMTSGLDPNAPKTSVDETGLRPRSEPIPQADPSPAQDEIPEIATADVPSAPNSQRTAAITPVARVHSPQANIAEPAPETEPLDLEALGERLKSTEAIGFFTKLEIRGQVNDLIDDFETFHHARTGSSLSQLEERFNLLFMKLLTLLQDDDPLLHHDIARARPALWTTLSDRDSFIAMNET